jgi:hypothetical protein
VARPKVKQYHNMRQWQDCWWISIIRMRRRSLKMHAHAKLSAICQSDKAKTRASVALLWEKQHQIYQEMTTSTFS